VGVDAIVAPQVVTKAAVRNLAALTSLGARFIPVMDRLLVPWGMWKGRREGGAVFLGPGGSNAAGCLGWVEAGLELCRQVASGELPSPSQIYITAGTAGTSAGLLVGLTLGGMRTHLRLVSAVEPLYFNRFIFRQKVALAWRALNDLGLRTRAAHGDVRWSIDHSQVGGGYAVPSSEGRAAVDWARDRGVSLETTYTGKCAAALMGDLRAGLVEGSTLLWNTHASTDVTRYISEGWRETLPATMRRWIAVVPSP
jgi:D-cysteine desulfhydrase